MTKEGGSHPLCFSFFIVFLVAMYSDTPRESDEDTEQQQQQQQNENNVAGSDETDSLFQAFADDARDGIAEPIYHLISEVFELRGVFGTVPTFQRPRRRVLFVCFFLYVKAGSAALSSLLCKSLTEEPSIGNLLRLNAQGIIHKI